jgi:hypothetical protein
MDETLCPVVICTLLEIWMKHYVLLLYALYLKSYMVHIFSRTCSVQVGQDEVGCFSPTRTTISKVETLFPPPHDTG